MSNHRTDWHAAETDLAAYLTGSTTPLIAASVETHLLACADCRDRLSRIADDGERDEAWDRLADAIDRPTPSLLQRLTRGHAAMAATVATPLTLRAALLAVVLVGLIPLAPALFAGEAGLALLLVLAPLAPTAAVAVSYRTWADPAGEITLSTPSAGLRLVAMRALVVALAALPLAVGVVWLADTPVRLAFAWCLPGVALAGCVLLVGTTRMDPLRAAVGFSLLWAVLSAIPASARRGPRAELVVELITSPALQITALLVAVAALLLTVVRRDAVAYRRIA